MSFQIVPTGTCSRGGVISESVGRCEVKLIPYKYYKKFFIYTYKQGFYYSVVKKSTDSFDSLTTLVFTWGMLLGVVR